MEECYMKISVVIAYHDEKQYIKDCLASLAEQTFQDFEVILVCDGCEAPEEGIPETLNIVTVMQEEKGVAGARNAGIEKAQGEYVVFLDADDYLAEDTLEALAEKAEPETVVYISKTETWYSRKVYQDNGEKLDEQNDTNGDEGEETKVDPENPYEYLIANTKKWQNISTLGLLIPRRLLIENPIRFCEELEYDSDIPVLMEVLAKAPKTVYQEKGTYIKRKHNDPINLPSLLQKKDAAKKVAEAMKSYRLASPFADGENAKVFHYRFAMCLVTMISPYMIESKAAERKETAKELKQTLEILGKDGWADIPLKHHPRKLIAYGLAGDADKIVKKTRNHARRQTLFRVCTSRAKCKRYLYEKVFSKMKMFDDMVIFESFFGKSYSDSPKYIFEYMNETYPGKYRYMWVNAGKKLNLPYPSKQMKRFSFKYFFYMARAKYIVFNGRQPQYFIKRKGNVFLETWHGTPLKKLVFDMEDVTTASPLYKEQFYIQTRSWDYLVAPNRFSEDVFRHAFMYDGKMLETGYPRNDILYCQDKEKRMREIKEELHLPQDKKIILYAPTWRDDEFYGHAKYKFTLQLDLAKMQKELGDEYIILLRTHYFIADVLDLSEYEGFAYNLSKYDDIARLYLISDVLITDYSSVFFDYANLRRPMLFFTYDLEKYRSVLRGFYIDVEEELPGPMLMTTDEVIGALQNIEKVVTEYSDKYTAFCDKYCAWEDGTAAKKVVETVFSDKSNK